MRKIINPLILVFLLSISALFIINCGGGESSSVPSQTQQYIQVYNPSDLPATDGELSEHIKGEVLIRYKKGADPSIIAGTVNGTVIDTFSFKEKCYGRVKLIEGTSVVESIKTLMKSEGVIYGQPDIYTLLQPFTRMIQIIYSNMLLHAVMLRQDGLLHREIRM